VDRKYDKFPNLILAHVWHVNDANLTATYALTQREATAIAETMGWTKTASWARGAYTARISPRLAGLLEPYRMTPAAWRTKLEALARSFP
jgi:hypothetical protein